MMNLTLPKARDFLAIPFWLGLLAGILEACQHWAFRNNAQILTIQKVPVDIFWIAPVVYVLLLLPLAALFLGISKLAPRLTAWWFDACLFLAGLVASYSQVRLTGKIHKIGIYALSLGVAITLVRLRRAAPQILPRLRAIAAASLPIIVCTAVATTAFHARQESSLIEKRPAQPAKGPNFLVLVMDTVRADHLSVYGYGRKTTPELEEFAQRGVVFENAWSNSSWTVPAHASLLTGLQPYQHGAGRTAGLSDKFLVLPEFLHTQGYRTGAFMANDLWLSPEYGFSRGFERFRVYTPWNVAARTFYGSRLYLFLTEKLNYRDTRVRRLAPMINQELLSWIEEKPADAPFFALVNYFDVHDPYRPPPPFDTKFQGPLPAGAPEEVRKRADIVNLYDGLVGYLDLEIGRMLRELERKQILQNTVVMIVADHGESLGSHGLLQHGDSLYRELSRVPLVVFGPGVTPGIRPQGAVSLRRIPATIAALASGKDEAAPFPGPSFVSQLRGGAEEERDNWVLLELRRVGGALAAKSLVNGKWHYIWNADSGKEEIYDMSADPAEKLNLANSPETAPQLVTMRARLAGIFPDLPIAKPGN